MSSRTIISPNVGETFAQRLRPSDLSIAQVAELDEQMMAAEPLVGDTKGWTSALRATAAAKDTPDSGQQR